MSFRAKLGNLPATLISRSGFTLIELLVATTIVIMISAFAMVSYTGANQTARNNKRKADLEQIRIALELYREERGVYPDVANYAGLSVLAPDYINDLPQDPKDSTYNYEYRRTDAYNYNLCAFLEGTASGAYCGTCGGGGCNYRVQSP